MRKASGRAAAVKAADVRLAPSLAQAPQAGLSWILCPWLERFGGERGMWLSVLAAHDANGALLETLQPSKRARPDVYAAVFAVDPLRTSAQLISAVKDAGIGGVINLPSVSFIDGEAGATFDSLSLGIEREIDFLETCSKQGLRIAGVVRSLQSAQRLLSSGVDFLITHGGPPTSSEPDPGADIAMKIAAPARANDVPVIPISQLLRADRRSA